MLYETYTLLKCMTCKVRFLKLVFPAHESGSIYYNLLSVHPPIFLLLKKSLSLNIRMSVWSLHFDSLQLVLRDPFADTLELVPL